MREGLYAIRFEAGDGVGSGVLFFEGGRIRGGDSRMYYTGRYALNGDMFSADMTVRTHTDLPPLRSLFGRDAFSLALHGNFARDPAEMIAVSPDAPGVEFRATLVRLPEEATDP